MGEEEIGLFINLDDVNDRALIEMQEKYPKDLLR